MNFEWFAGVAPVSDPKLALVALVVNDNRWKIKGNYVGKEAFSAYFGYPSSMPPVYAKAKGKRGGKIVSAAKKKGKHHKAAARKRGKKARGTASAGENRTASAAIPG
jgi:hypothetical protein